MSAVKTIDSVRALIAAGNGRVSREDLPVACVLMQNRPLRKRVLAGERVSYRGQAVTGLAAAIEKLTEKGELVAKGADVVGVNLAASSPELVDVAAGIWHALKGSAEK